MPLKSEEDDSDLKPKELVFLLAIAGRIDAQSRLLAQKLDENRLIYHAYAILDSLSYSYSMFKYFFEVCAGSSNPDLMHDFLTSPEGIAAVTAEALFLVSFAFLASIYDREKNESVKKFIVSAWPYLRDIMQCLKYTYKGWRSTMQVIGLLGGIDLKYLIIPVGVGLGIFGAAIRFWLRGVVERRRKQMECNKELLIEIQKLSALTPLDRNHYLSRIGEEERCTRAYFAVAACGSLDGLYFYMGVGSLSVFVPHLFIAITVLGGIYTVACVISRIYEEYDFQLRVLISQTKCTFALVTKEMELTYAKLLFLQGKVHKTSNDLDEIGRLTLDVCRLITDFDALRRVLGKQTTHSYVTAGLLGMKYGLFAYGVVTNILFMVSSVFLISASAFPPALLTAFIISGLVLMIGFTAFMLRSHHVHVQKQKQVCEEERPYAQLLEMKSNLEVNINAEILTADCFGKSLKDGTTLAPPPRYFFQEWLEFFLSLATGVSYGNNFSNFALTPLKEADSEGHYHDTPAMGIIGIASGVLFALVLGLRALARGFGRSPLASVKKADSLEDALKTEAPRESTDYSEKKSPDSSPGSLVQVGFFNKKPTSFPPHQRTLVHSKSEPTLDRLQTNGSTVLGLE